MPLPVRCSTSSTSAIDVSQVPTWEISCPVKNSRKLRTPSDGERGARARAWFLGSRLVVPLDDPIEDVGRARKGLDVGGVELVQPDREPRRAPRPPRVDPAPPRGRDRDPDDAAVGVVGPAFDEAGGGEFLDGAR